MSEELERSVNSILELHRADEKQLRFITTASKKVVVQAPAGFGKTRTMVSKLAYVLTKNEILAPKKILALTFSVNAAYKIKKDVIEQLPNVLTGKGTKSITLSKKISVSNYHGFCRKILSRYGYLLHENLKEINKFTSFDDGRERNINELGLGVSRDVTSLCVRYNEQIKGSNIGYLRQHFGVYNDNVIANFIPHEYIPFNAILTLTIKLFHEHPNVLSFYQKLYPIVFVDEFQDTNFFGYTILQKIINENTSAYFMGDPLQRIYGFIGAIPNILQAAKEKYDMEEIKLETNYRFRNNLEMLCLDNNVRRNAENIISPSIVDVAKVKLKLSDNQELESQYVFNKCQQIISTSEEDKIAVLFRNGPNNKNTQKIIEEFDRNGAEYFYGLFSDEDENYKRFHFNCAKEFSSLLKQKRLSKTTCKKHVTKIKAIYASESNPLYNSLIHLMEIFYDRLYNEYGFILLEDEDKIILIKETFDGLGLKQFMEYVDSRIIISTIHGAKGLEWDYVLMPDMEQFSLPSWFGFCGDCSHKSDCQLHPGSANQKYIEEISVFYVGFTRAKKDVFFSASREGIKSNGDAQPRNVSCFLKMSGIDIDEQ
jgi:DNA helicase-2/ATP-dependent DNA helicase PcrA